MLDETKVKNKDAAGVPAAKKDPNEGKVGVLYVGVKTPTFLAGLNEKDGRFETGKVTMIAEAVAAKLIANRGHLFKPAPKAS